MLYLQLGGNQTSAPLDNPAQQDVVCGAHFEKQGARFVAPLVYPIPINNILRGSTSFPSLPILPARLTARHAREL